MSGAKIYTYLNNLDRYSERDYDLHSPIHNN